MKRLLSSPLGRAALALWVVGIGLQIADIFVRKRRLHIIILEAAILCILPVLIGSVIAVIRIRRELRRLEVEMTVYETLLKMADPEAYKRTMALREAKKRFKGKNLFKSTRKG